MSHGARTSGAPVRAVTQGPEKPPPNLAEIEQTSPPCSLFHSTENRPAIWLQSGIISPGKLLCKQGKSFPEWNKLISIFSIWQNPATAITMDLGDRL
jgi:hypothetical protein